MKKSYSLSELSQLSTASEDAENLPTTSTLRRSKSGDNLRNTARMAVLFGSQPQAAAATHTRTPLLSEKELRDHFNMPLNEVAKKYGMCTTALKKLCRKYGVMQWPHRKLKSLEKRIASLRAEQRYTTDGQGHIDEEIRKLEQQREGLVKGDALSDVLSRSRSASPTGRSPGDDTFGQDDDDIMDDTERMRSWSGSAGARVKVEEMDRDRLQQHILTLEEENHSLRALSRTLLRERQELMAKTTTRADEVASLKRMCDELKSQLLLVARGGGLVDNKLLSVMVSPATVYSVSPFVPLSA